MGIVYDLRRLVRLPGVPDARLRAAAAGRRILITGASSGIGRAAAVRLGASGARAIVVARRKDELDAVVREIAERGGEARAYPADLRDEDACTGLVESVLRDVGGVDVLVNNAGHSIRRAMERSVDRAHDFERTMAINYFAAVRLTLGFLPGMLERGRGHVVNVSSLGVLAGAPHFAAYISSKAALETMGRHLAFELRPRGIAVTNINLGLVHTPMSAPTDHLRQLPGMSPEEAADWICEAIVRRPTRLSPPLGPIMGVLYTVAPGAMERLVAWGHARFHAQLQAQGGARKRENDRSDRSA